jgi:hypothetical protein
MFILVEGTVEAIALSGAFPLGYGLDVNSRRARSEIALS